MAETAIVPAPTGADLAEKVVVKGDLGGLTSEERMRYYTAVCESLGLNPLTRPFEYITLNGKLTLYATRAAADQLRVLRGITITSLDPRQIGDLYVVVATGRDRSGREDSSTGAVAVSGLRGEALANAMMKAETKAKRRLTLSLAGLGMTDETEVDSIPGAERVDSPAPLTLAEKAAAKRAEVEQEPQALYDGEGLFAEAEAPKLRLTRQEFLDRMDAAGVSQAHAAEVSRSMFTGPVSDEQRGELWIALEAEQHQLDALA